MAAGRPVAEAARGWAIFNQGYLAVSTCLFTNNVVVVGEVGNSTEDTTGLFGAGGLGGAGGNANGLDGGAGDASGGGAGVCNGIPAANGTFGGGGDARFKVAGGSGGFGGGCGTANTAGFGVGGSGGFGAGTGENGFAYSSMIPAGGGGGAGMGGGIFNETGTLNITNSTFTNNSAVAGDGGGSDNGLSGKVGFGLGGAVFKRNGTFNSINNTFSANLADEGGSVYDLADGGTLTSTIKNTILANSSGSAKDYYYNSINGGANSYNPWYIIIEAYQYGLPGVVSSADPGLGTVRYNSGPTFTMAISPGSNAWNTGDDPSASALSTDQRGDDFARIVDTVEIGAFEYQFPNQLPFDIQASNSDTFENQDTGTYVGSLATFDPDSFFFIPAFVPTTATYTPLATPAPARFTYTLVSGDGDTGNANFQISGSHLQTKVRLDFEMQQSHRIRIRTTDWGGLFYEKVFIITVINVNEAPVITSGNTGTTSENAATTMPIYIATATDVDADTTITYSIKSGKNAKRVSIDGSTGGRR